MSPILRRTGDEYDPRKRRAALYNHLATTSHQDDDERKREREEGNKGEEPLISPDATGHHHRSYGSEHSDDTQLPERGKPVVVVDDDDDDGHGHGHGGGERLERTRELAEPPIPAFPHPGTTHPPTAAAAAAPPPPAYLKRTLVHLALTLAVQSTPALLLSLTGLVFTGQLLDHLAVWSVFRRVDELFILVPVLGNLKGNLEMCLGARLGTSANRGHLDTPARRRSIIAHAITFLLLQALTISSIAGVLSFLLGLLLNHRVAPSDASNPPAGAGAGTGVDGPHREGYTPPGPPEFILVVGTGMAAACMSSLILGSFMSTLIIACRSLGLDPDNIASPLAATLGDLLTLFIMALVGTCLVRVLGTPVPVVCVGVMCLATGGIWWSLRRMKGRRDEEGQGGWSPLIGAMLISSATGLVLDRSVNRYKGFAILAISITGIAGSIGAIHASRLSTALHAARKTRHHREEAETRASSPLLGFPPSAHHHSPAHKTTLATTDAPAVLTNIQSGITLFLISWPIQGVFVAFVWMSGWIQLGGLLTFWVGVVYGVTVALSIYLAQVMTLFFWSKNLDPDSYTLPVHSSLIDLLGQIFLVIAFEVAALMGADVVNVDGVR
ncbi:hypothetical protein QFC21_005859 [Naganishia friedmannii]|uniref:Uncharacterized protein n=1 Tax=Naganishia friedmannii TaxID=89922 RepID=A0ACC2V604_9TREE|nr:hypothetical protein QFC21_005859 [Naganishia friedmannii]